MRIIDYLPPVLQQIGDFVQISNAEQIQFDSFDDAVSGTVDDMYLSTLTENGASRWEKQLKLVPKGTDTLPVRRFRIQAKFNEQTPYTIGTLNEKLKMLCGEGNFSVSLEQSSLTMTVRISLVVKQYYEEAVAFVNRIVPANLLVDMSLIYRTWGELETYTWGDLENLTWDDVLEGEL